MLNIVTVWTNTRKICLKRIGWNGFFFCYKLIKIKTKVKLEIGVQKSSLQITFTNIYFVASSSIKLQKVFVFLLIGFEFHGFYTGINLTEQVLQKYLLSQFKVDVLTNE